MRPQYPPGALINPKRIKGWESGRIAERLRLDSSVSTVESIVPMSVVWVEESRAIWDTQIRYLVDSYLEDD